MENRRTSITASIVKSSRLPPGKDVYDPQGLPSKGHFTENWPSFGSTGYFRGKLAPFLGLSGILSGRAPPSNIQHDTPPSTIGGKTTTIIKTSQVCGTTLTFTDICCVLI